MYEVNTPIPRLCPHERADFDPSGLSWLLADNIVRIRCCAKQSTRSENLCQCYPHFHWRNPDTSMVRDKRDFLYGLRRMVRRAATHGDSNRYSGAERGSDL